MKPAFSLLRAHHMGRTVTAAQVYEAIGHPSSMASDPVWQNTCAIRMSVALIGAGMAIRPGRLKIRDGPFKGKMVEPGQHRLSEYLAREIGTPQRFKGGDAAMHGIGSQNGIISFFQIAGPTSRQGHIYLVSPNLWHGLICNGFCYWGAVDVWFWALD